MNATDVVMTLNCDHCEKPYETTLARWRNDDWGLCDACAAQEAAEQDEMERHLEEGS